MIITRSPFRISFIGGGSDLEAFYSQSKGAVLSTSIDKYMYISSHPFFNRKGFQLKYSETELTYSVDEINHNIFREVLRKFKVKGGLEISSNADIPAGTGLGSSSAFTVGLLHNMHTLSARYATKELLASEASEMEIEILKAPIGKQDQYASAYGGLNIIEFLSDGSVCVEPIVISREEKKILEKNIVMFYTKKQRSASDILKKQKHFMADNDKVSILKEMIPYVYRLRDELYQRNFDYLGEVLHKGWMLKKQIAEEISNPAIDDYYEKALAAGALGGKLLGAGGGGFLLFYCPLEKQNELREALKDLYELNFSFDYEGSKVIYAGEYEKVENYGFFE